MAPKHDVLPDLNPFEILLTSILKVEVYNASYSDCNTNKWEIIYEVFVDEESIECVIKNSNGHTDGLGRKATIVYELEVL